MIHALFGIAVIIKYAAFAQHTWSTKKEKSWNTKTNNNDNLKSAATITVVSDVTEAILKAIALAQLTWFMKRNDIAQFPGS